MRMSVRDCSMDICLLKPFLYLCSAPKNGNALKYISFRADNALQLYFEIQELMIQIKWNHTEKGQLPPWKTAVVANRTCHPWPTSKSLWLTLWQSVELEKCELAKEEKEQLGTKEIAETLLALVEESADEQSLTATWLKIQTAKRHFPPWQAKPSKMTVSEV